MADTTTQVRLIGASVESSTSPCSASSVRTASALRNALVIFVIVSVPSVGFAPSALRGITSQASHGHG